MRVIERVVVLVLMAVLGPLLPLPARAAPPALAQTLGRLERDIGGAIGLVLSLREQVVTADLAEAGATTAAGIADGGYVSTLRALRAASARLERRLDELHRQLPGLDGQGADDILLAMRLELAALELAFEAVLAEPDAAGRQDAVARIGEALTSLDGATAAIWTLDGVGAARAASERFFGDVHGDEVSDHPPRPPPSR